jgi:hypothetical protein
MGPKQVPDNSEHGPEWENWEDWRLPEKTSVFTYSDSTKEHIENGESQHFHYEGNDLPEKD